MKSICIKGILFMGWNSGENLTYQILILSFYKKKTAFILSYKWNKKL